jgi:hypothetical protein
MILAGHVEGKMDKGNAFKVLVGKPEGKGPYVRMWLESFGSE